MVLPTQVADFDEAEVGTLPRRLACRGCVLSSPVRGSGRGLARRDPRSVPVAMRSPGLLVGASDHSLVRHSLVQSVHDAGRLAEDEGRCLR